MTAVAALPQRMPVRRFRIAGEALLILPAAGYLALVFAIPLILLLAESFYGADGWSLAGYVKFLGDPYNLAIVWRSLRLAGLTTIFSLLLSYPAAFGLATVSARWQGLLVACLFVPLALSVVVKAFGWTILLRGNGAISQGLQALGLTDGPLRLIFTETGLLIGAVNLFLPFMLLPLYSVVRLLDPRLTEAAATLGAPPAYSFFKVTLPLTLPGAVAGSALVFSLTVSAYVVPTLLMGDRYQVLPTVIAKSFLFMRDTGAGAVVGTVLLAITLLVIALSGRLGERPK